MTEVDAFAAQLLDEARRFLEKAVAESCQEGKAAYLHAALVLGFASLEAHLNSTAEDFLVRDDISPLDRSILSEREISLEHGHWIVSDKLKIYRIEDRLEFIQRRFSRAPIDKASPMWSALKAGLHLRNKLTHPRGAEAITESQTRQALEAVMGILDSLYQALYKRPFPAARRGLETTMSF